MTTISTGYKKLALAGATSLLVMGFVASAQAAGGQCTPGKTKRIAFMMKQQTAFRYLHADMPFFKKAAEAAGYTVLVQSAEVVIGDHGLKFMW